MMTDDTLAPGETTDTGFEDGFEQNDTDPQTAAQTAAPVAASAAPLTADEQALYTQIWAFALEQSVQGLSLTLGQDIQTSQLKLQCLDSLNDLAEPFAGGDRIMALVEYFGALSGSCLWLLSAEESKGLADLMLGGVGQISPGAITDLQISALSEAMSQMVNHMTQSLNNFASELFEANNPVVRPYDGEFLAEHLPTLSNNAAVVTQHIQLLIGEDQQPFTLIQVCSLAQVREELALLEAFNVADAAQLGQGNLGSQDGSSTLGPESASEKAPQGPSNDEINDILAEMGLDPLDVSRPAGGERRSPTSASGGSGRTGASATGASGVGSASGSTSAHTAVEDLYKQTNPVTVQPIQFASFDQHPSIQGEQNRNLELVLDVTLNLTVELGKTELSIKDVLELARGSVIELDRVAGEPVDLLANGKLIAKGEVVVIEDNFGLRITSIVSPADRLRGL